MATPRRRFYMREFTILASVLLAIAMFGALEPRFLSVDSALAILEGASSDGLMVIGMTIVIVCGAFDMSVGSAMAFCGLVAALAMKDWGFPVPLAVLAALAAGAVIGWINGAIVTRLKINPFITTLGMMSILRGMVQVITRRNTPTGFPESFLSIAWGTVFTLALARRGFVRDSLSRGSSRGGHDRRRLALAAAPLSAAGLFRRQQRGSRPADGHSRGAGQDLCVPADRRLGRH